ncbi:MAG: hypothetical protein GEU74_16215 [Nitriliruptorales bacterium]|nr:hypothetical protein [Nitriliruptorales bacterium]
MVRHVNRQQVQVFAKFSAAVFMIGLAYTYAALGNDAMAVATGVSAILLVVAIIAEARTS